uniref:Uncharacterized protein n=1 Tax=Arundo donax TaxID=35708 RepID=A0A0A9AZI6_ARUDO
MGSAEQSASYLGVNQPSWSRIAYLVFRNMTLFLCTAVVKWLGSALENEIKDEHCISNHSHAER